MRPPPQYPLAASLAGVTGRGVAILDVDPLTGSVKAARINPSTGDKDLDHAVLKAFRQWQFRAGGASRVNVPIRFTNGPAAGDEPYHRGMIWTTRFMRRRRFIPLKPDVCADSGTG
jgi:TonB family protein